MDMISVRHGLYQHGAFQLSAEFALAAGSFTAILGPSGAGKSTLLNVLAGFEAFRAGEIWLDGANHTDTPPEERPVNLVFQDNNVFSHLSAHENVGLGISPSLRLSAQQISDVDAALTRVGLHGLEKRKPGEMSGGERQRIALARCLVRKKPILLLDEALASLGPALRHDMISLIKNLQQENGLTILMVTHDPRDAALAADGIIFLDQGTVQRPVPTAAFFSGTDEAVLGYLGEFGELPAAATAAATAATRKPSTA